MATVSNRTQRIIAEILTKDVVEMVRCEDCAYHQEDGVCTRGIHGVGYKITCDFDFCSYGEKKQQCVKD